jgi:hypothetical protein
MIKFQKNLTEQVEEALNLAEATRRDYSDKIKELNND